MTDRWRNPWPREWLDRRCERPIPVETVARLVVATWHWLSVIAESRHPDDAETPALRIRAGARHACARLRVQLAEERYRSRRAAYERHMGAWETDNLAEAQRELDRARRVLAKMDGKT